MSYQEIPTCTDFERDLNLINHTREKKLSESERVKFTDLLKKFEANKKSGNHEYHIIQLYLTTKYWLSKVGKKPKTGPKNPQEKFTAGQKTVELIQALNVIIHSKLSTYLKESNIDNADNNIDVDALLFESFQVNSHMAKEDDFESKDVICLSSDEDRRRYKIKFRNGMAYRCNSLDGGNEVYILYDTKTSGESECSDEWVHFALDKRGRLYVGFRKDKTFFHSSFLAGDPVICAGKLRIVNGQITGISDESGHYQPTALNIANALYLLMARGVNVDVIWAYTYKNKEAPYSAREIMTARDWFIRKTTGTKKK